jgi:hypothetical protein
LVRGKGDGNPCACCDRLINDAQIQFEVEYQSGDGVRMALMMHAICFDVWREESRGHRVSSEPRLR